MARYNVGLQTKTVAAVNDATAGMEVPARTLVSVSVEGGAFVATIALQRSFDQGVTWFTIETYTAAVEKNMETAERQQVRLIATAFTSGSPALRLSY